jgi:F5/8 type C domain.
LIRPRTLAYLNYERYGWQRFGEYFDNIFLEPFIEGAWMNKFNGKYYLQFATPGTEFSGYADGVMIAENPLGPFVFQKHNPFSSKLGGFIRGAGHGATFYYKYGNLWHVATGVISVKNNFERRIGLWPAGVDKDGVLYCNTTFGDFPHFIPQQRIDCPDSLFTGWMLLNFNKPVQVSSTFGGYVSNYAVDEDIKTFWSATTGNKGEWIVSDMGDVCTVFAVQINYADMDAQFMGKINDIYHQYIVYASSDGKQWKTIIDKSNNTKDIPHDYVELPTAVKARYLKLLNLHVPSGKFAISGFRIFGKGNGFPPDSVKNFIVLRTQKDKRSAWIKWSPVDNAYAYNIYVGTAPDKLYTSIMVYGKNEYFYKSMDKDISYYFTIVAINENGVSSPLRVVKG